jgi:hypothetical protein
MTAEGGQGVVGVGGSVVVRTEEKKNRREDLIRERSVFWHRDHVTSDYI